MAEWPELTEAERRVYSAQVQDIVSDNDMQAFQPESYDLKDTIEIHIEAAPPKTGLLQMLSRFIRLQPRTHVSQIILQCKPIEQGWECISREEH